MSHLDVEVGVWCYHRREEKRSGKLSAERVLEIELADRETKVERLPEFFLFDIRGIDLNVRKHYSDLRSKLEKDLEWYVDPEWCFDYLIWVRYNIFKYCN